MSYIPTPPPAEEPAPEPGNRRDLWLGILVGVVACIALPFLSALGADALGLFGFGLLAPLLVLVAGVILVIPDRTRRWGTGLLMGFAVSVVVGAGACVVLIASYNSMGA
ncbi:MAG: hypothetical protein ACXWXO_01930 [Nocardioides sp.]